MGNVESNGQGKPGVPAEHLASSKPVYPSLGRFTCLLTKLKSLTIKH